MYVEFYSENVRSIQFIFTLDVTHLSIMSDDIFTLKLINHA